MTAPDIEMAAPPHVRRYCACRDEWGRHLFIDALDHPKLIAHALAVHYQTPEHRRWRESWQPPSFDVRVVTDAD